MRAAAVGALVVLAVLTAGPGAAPLGVGPGGLWAAAPAAGPSAPPLRAAGGRSTPTVVVYSRPVPGAVVRPFVPPPTPYAAGHRGVDLSAAVAAAVRAAADGVVRFAGPVAARGVLVLAHADGITTEYEPVRPLVRPGAVVRRGQTVAVVSGRHPGCPRSCLHWGARRGADYLDPLTLLRPLGPVVLLPWPRTA